MWTPWIVLLVVLCLCLCYYASGRSIGCKIDPSGTTPFCAIKTIDFALPGDVRKTILRHVDDRSSGKRVEIPMVRAGRTMTAEYVTKHMPGLVDVYKKAAESVSRTVGRDVSMASLENALSLSIIVYEKERDGIHWHYDDNYFRGRFFTLLIPVTQDDTCTVFQYQDSGTHDVRIEPGQALLFEGSKLLHRATPLCDGQRRVIVSMQFSTDARVKNPWLMRLKEVAFTGLRFW